MHFSTNLVNIASIVKEKRPVFKELSDVAKLQSGYFTSKQAQEAGYDYYLQSYHVKAGNWERAARGIYRFADFPILENDQYVLWYLWSRDRNDRPQGVYSHETALSIYELSDASPSKLHITVPLSFRRNSKIPDILILHYDTMDKEDIEFMQGFAVTNPMRTILDLAKTGFVSRDILAQAITEGCQRGLLLRSKIQERKELDFLRPWISHLFKEYNNER